MEKLEWNLNQLFESKKAFYNEIDHISKMIKEIRKRKNIKLDSNSLLNILDTEWKIKELSNNVLLYGSLMYYKNINDKECIKLKNNAEKFNNEIITSLKFIDVKILDLGLEKISEFILENPKLKTYEFSLNNLFRLQGHIQTDEINAKVKENIDEINEKLNIYNSLQKDIIYGSINIDGKEIEITTSNYAKYISSRDRETRKQAYFVVNVAYQNEKDEFAKLLNSIYGYRTKNSTLEKYKSVLEKVLFEENIDSKIIKKLIESVNNNLNLAQNYLQIKADLLEIENPHLYDFGVPLDSNLKIKYSVEEAKKIIINALEPLGEEYIKTVELLFDGHIDAEPSENKHQSITFSWNTYSFMNFKGAYVDLKNLIHEIGHIVNYYLSNKHQPFIYEDSTIFVGETASIVNEILLNRYLYKNSKTKKEEIFYLSKEIENYFTSVFKQTMYTEFENDLYDTRMNFELTPEILCKKYSEIIRKYYGDNIIYDDIANIEWTRLSHLYRWSYYPYKYATGLLIASTVVDALVDKKILSKEDYIKFLEAGSSKYSLDLLEMLNVDLINTDIMETGFNVMAEDISKLENLLSLEKKQFN